MFEIKICQLLLKTYNKCYIFPNINNNNRYIIDKSPNKNTIINFEYIYFRACDISKIIKPPKYRRNISKEIGKWKT